MNLSQLNRLLLRMLLLPVLALLVVAGILTYQILNSNARIERIQRVEANIATAAVIQSLIIDEETGLRGYQTTGNEIFLQPYNFAPAPLDRALTELRANMARNLINPRPEMVDQLRAMNDDWRKTIAEPIIADVRAGKDTRDSGMNLRGKARMDAMRTAIKEIIEDQRLRRGRGMTNWQNDTKRILEILFGLSLVMGLMIGTFARNQLHAVSLAFRKNIEDVERNARATELSEQRLRTTLTSIGDAVVVCDLNGNVEMLNTVAEHLTGWSQAEALGKPLEDIFHIVDEFSRKPLETPAAIVMREKKVVTLSNHALLLRRDGTELHIDDSGAPICDHNGNLTGVVMVFRDITAQRQTQAALLASEKLAVAGRLAATIAHEIHNPLDAVINLLYLMKNNPSAEESQEFLAMASSELDRVAQISRAMLGMYRESKTPVAIDLGALLASVLLLLERNFTQAEVNIVTHFESDAIITGYPAELRQVFTNLISNALDASTAGDTIYVTARKQESASPAERGVNVAITDTGEGIPEEAMGRLFQPFFTTKGERGTGLGLWVSQGILQKHGGTITLDTNTTTADHGSTVTVFLPRGGATLA